MQAAARNTTTTHECLDMKCPRENWRHSTLRAERCGFGNLAFSLGTSARRFATRGGPFDCSQGKLRPPRHKHLPGWTCPAGICPSHFEVSTLKSCPSAADVLMDELYFP